MTTVLVASEVKKTFIMHMRGGVELPVVANVSFSLKAGSCAVLGGPSGVGKSSILKMLYGNYDRLCQPVPACGAACVGTGRGGRAAADPRR